MTAPKLPQSINPPQIPNSMRKGAEQQEPPKSNFMFILLMTVLIIWSLQVFRSKEQDPAVSVENTPVNKPDVASELTDKARASLPKDFVENAERERESVKPLFVALGSLDANSPYKMLVTLSNRGASVTRVELNENAYADNSDKTGYMGQIIVDESLANDETRAGLPGVAAQIVGEGSPVSLAGLRAGDRIVSFIDDQGTETKINEFLDLRDALRNTKPGDKIRLGVIDAERVRANEQMKVASLVVANKYMRRSARPSEILDDISEANPTSASEDLESENQESNVSDSNEGAAEPSSELEENVVDDAPLFQPQFEIGEPKYIDVQLIRAPLSVLRPSGMVRDYEDYLNLDGLQGGVIDFGDNDDNYLRNIESNVRKLNGDPNSFLTTLTNVDGDQLSQWVPKEPNDKRVAALGASRSRALDAEPSGVDLRNGFWEYSSEESSENVAVFKKSLLERGLVLVKKYELAQTTESANKKSSSGESELGVGRGYHLKLTLQIRNCDPNNKRTIAFAIDGPTGLPLEGAWFSAGRKTGPKMGSYGLRDVVVSANDRKSFDVISCWNISQDNVPRSDETKLDFLGVDGQYFQSTMIPVGGNGEERFAFSPIRVGSRVPEHMNFTNVSFRLKSVDKNLAPAGQEGDSVSQEFVVFIGPKQRDVLSDYGLSKTVVYGWFWFVSIPLLWILHFFHDYVVFNYGLAIMLLTVLVRLCLYPLSRKQVQSSMKMQLLQPEIAALKEKYKDSPQEMMAAQQALFKKYGVNPLSGCLPIFIQMPIFIGLYRALSIDVNLYGAPLFARSVRWCSNLAAPDMAFDWHGFWNSIGWTSFNMNGRGFLSMFCLGPYLNILPVITIALFLIQQKLLVPPVMGDDEQARQQRSMRKMMNFMMIFMGFMFFKVPSGLCVYFIVSSLWGLLERKLLPKKDVQLVPVGSASSSASRGSVKRGSRRGFEIHELKRDKKGRRVFSDSKEENKSSLRAWWNEVVERAKEQQRLATAEEEERSRLGAFRNKGKTKRR